MPEKNVLVSSEILYDSCKSVAVAGARLKVIAPQSVFVYNYYAASFRPAKL